MHNDSILLKLVKVRPGRGLYALVLLTLLVPVAMAAEGDQPGTDMMTSASDATMETLSIDPNQAEVDFSEEGCVIKFIAFQKESSIRDGLRLLAALCRKNIIPSAGVDGSLNVSRLYNVTFEEALKAVLGIGFKYQQDGQFIRVYTAEEYKKIKEDPDRMVFKIITLYYMTAEEAETLIRPVLSARRSLPRRPRLKKRSPRPAVPVPVEASVVAVVETRRPVTTCSCCSIFPRMSSGPKRSSKRLISVHSRCWLKRAFSRRG